MKLSNESQCVSDLGISVLHVKMCPTALGNMDGSGQGHMWKWMVRDGYVNLLHFWSYESWLCMHEFSGKCGFNNPICDLKPKGLDVKINVDSRCAIILLPSMHMLPKSHNSGFYKHSADSKFHIDYTMVDTPQPEDVRNRRWYTHIWVSLSVCVCLRLCLWYWSLEMLCSSLATQLTTHLPMSLTQGEPGLVTSE